MVVHVPPEKALLSLDAAPTDNIADVHPRPPPTMSYVLEETTSLTYAQFLAQESAKHAAEDAVQQKAVIAAAKKATDDASILMTSEAVADRKADEAAEKRVASEEAARNAETKTAHDAELSRTAALCAAAAGIDCSP